MPARELPPSDLYRRCDVEKLPFGTTDDLEPLEEIVGQPRAVEAVRFGVDIAHQGYNIFALGPPGTGKHSLVRQFLEKRAAQEPAPDDWCYVNNFDQPHVPKAIGLPPGRGRELRDDVNHLLDDIPGVISAAFESDEYRRRRQKLAEEFATEQQQAIEELQEKARRRGLHMMATTEGLAFAPIGADGEPMSPEETRALTENRREELERAAQELQEQAQRLLLQAPRAQRQARRKAEELKRQAAEQALRPLLDELHARYKDLPKVLEYIDAVFRDLVDHAEDLLKIHRAEQEGKPPELEAGIPTPLPPAVAKSALLRQYRVNLLVEHDRDGHAPLLYEDNPVYPNVIGRVDHLVHMGTLMADFNLIQPGALHRANGGYLVLDAHKVLMYPFVWEGLKRALRAQEARIESLVKALGLVQTVTLEPEPIPLKIKVVLTGTPLLYHLLRLLDPEFAELFKVPADFATDMNRTDEEQHVYARLIAALTKRESLRAFDKAAVARVIEHSSRLAGDAAKLSVHMRSIADLLHEADYWAGHNGNGTVKADDVQRAIDAQVFRCDRLRERLQEEILRGRLLISTEGSAVGQVNGLAVWPFGDVVFGRPTRITARARMGRGEVIDIEREVALGGPVHSKGVLILAGFLAGRYARSLPLSLSASLVFEQSYGEVSGDSASSAELYALLSAISGVPLRQSLGVTGSVNQQGQVQAIGAVNEKIEGFFEICRARGLNGEQGVIIPVSNVEHLMLRQEVIDAVQAGQFHIHAVQTVDEGIELLAGMPAGQPDEQGKYPPDSVNGKVAAALEEFASQRQKFGPPIKAVTDE